MHVMLATLCLNEMEWLPRLYEQHRHWPGKILWCFVEGADREYAAANPAMVSEEGLSVDGTSEFLQSLAEQDQRVVYVRHGFGQDQDKAQGKCPLRNRYLEVADGLRPELVVVLDADEFYPHTAQFEVNRLWQAAPRRVTAMCLRQRHLWRPPSVADRPLFESEVRGGFWAIPHCRLWRWAAGMRYVTNHNTPELAGRKLDGVMVRHDLNSCTPECVHLGYASAGPTRAAKSRYYEHRGELYDPRRKWYTDSRREWETWQPGGLLPRRAEVVPYTGPVPEVFKTRPNPTDTEPQGVQQ